MIRRKFNYPLFCFVFPVVMSRFFFLVFALCLLLMPQHTLAAEDTGRQTLYIVSDDFPPLKMAEPENGLHGYDYELVTRIFDELGFDTDIYFLPWPRALDDIKKGSALGALSCAYTDKRAKLMHFGTPLSQFTTGFFAKAGHDLPVPKTLTSVKGYDIGAVKGRPAMHELKAAGLDPLPAHDPSSALRMLQAGRFDYLYLNQETGRFKARKQKLDDQLVFYPIAKQDVYFCFNKRYPGVKDIMKAFEQKLAQFKKAGTDRIIRGKYR